MSKRRPTFSPSIETTYKLMSENSSRSHNFLITLLIFSPGRYSFSPTRSPVKAITVFSLYVVVPVTSMLPISYLVSRSSGKSLCAWAIVALKMSTKNAIFLSIAFRFNLVELFTCLSKSSFSFLIIINCVVQVSFRKVRP